MCRLLFLSRTDIPSAGYLNFNIKHWKIFSKMLIEIENQYLKSIGIGTWLSGCGPIVRNNHIEQQK